jgi:hypothetical protein
MSLTVFARKFNAVTSPTKLGCEAGHATNQTSRVKARRGQNSREAIVLAKPFARPATARLVSDW